MVGIVLEWEYYDINPNGRNGKIADKKGMEQ